MITKTIERTTHYSKPERVNRYSTVESLGIDWIDLEKRFRKVKTSHRDKKGSRERALLGNFDAVIPTDIWDRYCYLNTLENELDRKTWWLESNWKDGRVYIARAR